MSEFNISQSLMKALVDYQLGNECGLVFVQKYINKRYDLFPASDAQQVGNWAEYMMIGANTKKEGNKPPEPERTKDGKLTAPYKKMEAHVENYKKFIAFYNIEVISVQDKWIADGLEGTLDALCRSKTGIKDKEGNYLIEPNEDFIMDIKTSGLMSDYRSDYGWCDFSEKLSEKVKIVLQPIHYKHLSMIKFGKEYKFLFLLFSQANEYDYRALLFNIPDKQEFEFHKALILKTTRLLKKLLANGVDGFVAKPEVDRCFKCPIKLGCRSYKAVPDITVFNYQSPT